MIKDIFNNRMIDIKNITLNDCEKHGYYLAQLHSIVFQKNVNDKILEIIDWEKYLEHPNFENMKYKDEYLKNYKKYESLQKRVIERYNTIKNEKSISYKSIDFNNLEIKDNKIKIIDINKIDVINPYEELIEEALIWAGFYNKEFKKENFEAVIKGYTKIKSIQHYRYDIVCSNLINRFVNLKNDIELSLQNNSIDNQQKVLDTMEEIDRYIILIGNIYDIICNLTKVMNHDYDNIIEEIIKNNGLLKNKKYEFITAGFTNKIYRVEDYIIRICIDKDNEKRFKNEIDFYTKNENNPYIPKMYYYDISKNIVPYYYEIIERIEGKTLYEIWPISTKEEREEIIKKIVEILKSIHSIECGEVDFKQFVKNELMEVIPDIDNDVFEKLLNKFDIYFANNDIGLIHNDLHFDNFIYKDGKIMLLDFERSVVGSIDYDFKRFARCEEEPWLWASTDTDMLAIESDYEGFIDMFIDNYERLKNIKYLKERLEIYKIIDLLEQYNRLKKEDLLKDVTNRINKLI